MDIDGNIGSILKEMREAVELKFLIGLGYPIPGSVTVEGVGVPVKGEGES